MNEFQKFSSEKLAEEGFPTSGEAIKEKKGRMSVSWAICTIQVVALAVLKNIIIETLPLKQRTVSRCYQLQLLL
jgi:hypothetical protein